MISSVVSAMGIILIISGGVAIVGGIVGKTFYKADVVALEVFKSEDKWPSWFGRLLFIVVGVALIGVGVKLLVDAE
jgi:hypothetical protein